MYKVIIGIEGVHRTLDREFYFANKPEAESFYNFITTTKRKPKNYFHIYPVEKCVLETTESAIERFEKTFGVPLTDKDDKPKICWKCEGFGWEDKKGWFGFEYRMDCKECRGQGVFLSKQEG
jgi:hypothetical protein